MNGRPISRTHARSRRGRLWLGLALGALLAGLVPPEAEARRLGRRGRRTRLRLWDRVLRQRHERAMRLARQADRLRDRRRYKESARLLRRATQILPHSASLWFALGTVHSFAGAYRPCVRALKQARKLGPRYQVDLMAFRLGLCLSLSRRVNQGTAEYRKVRPHRGISAYLMNYNLADNYMFLGRLKDAIRHYRLAIQASPSSRILYFALAVALDRQGSKRQAERQMQRALQADPKARSVADPDILWLPAHDHLYFRALAAFVAGDRIGALQHWQQFLAKEPRSQWRWAITGRLNDLRLRALSKGDIRQTTGPLDRAGLAAGLVGLQGGLRSCLGAAPAGKTTGSAKAMRLVATAKARGLVKVEVVRRVGAVPQTASSCARRLLKKIRWRKLVTERQATASFSLDIVGP